MADSEIFNTQSAHRWNHIPIHSNSVLRRLLLVISTRRLLLCQSNVTIGELYRLRCIRPIHHRGRCSSAAVQRHGAHLAIWGEGDVQLFRKYAKFAPKLVTLTAFISISRGHRLLGWSEVKMKLCILLRTVACRMLRCPPCYKCQRNIISETDDYGRTIYLIS